MHSVVVDMVTVVMALYTLVIAAQSCITRTPTCSCLLPISICTTYLVAQSGWTTAFLSGNMWGAEYNNYIWFLFNALVFTHLIKGIKK